MKILVGFEESQVITIELRNKGHEAYSCDLKDCSGGYPEWHLKMDVFEAIKLKKWSGIILHPPCIFTALCGNRWYWDSPLRVEGIKLCSDAWNLACKVCDHVALEQPKTIMQRYIGKKSQVIHPWQHGHTETKETWLWLKGLPKLVETLNVKEDMDKLDPKEKHKIWYASPGKERSTIRSKTYSGIAKAIADQWFNLIQ